jgi:hypothetical protein
MGSLLRLFMTISCEISCLSACNAQAGKKAKENRNCLGSRFSVNAIVKSPKMPLSVIPAKAGIQSFKVFADHLDSGFHRGDAL